MAFPVTVALHADAVPRSGLPLIQFGFSATLTEPNENAGLRAGVASAVLRNLLAELADAVREPGHLAVCRVAMDYALLGGAHDLGCCRL